MRHNHSLPGPQLPQRLLLETVHSLTHDPLHLALLHSLELCLVALLTLVELGLFDQFLGLTVLYDRLV
jgi:hypothetical protein